MADDWDWAGEFDGFADPHLLALRELAALRPVLARLEASLVDTARGNGWSWAQIATELGLTKAGAYRRHGARDAARRRERRAASRRPFETSP